MHVEAAGRSDVGRVRSHNEDRYAIQRDLPGGAVLCLLADGMGGHAAGDVAATLAVEAALATFAERADVASAVARANAAVVARSAAAGERGMGTTLTCALVGPGAVQFAHVGDSRLYLLRDGALRQLSQDHSWVAEEVAAGRMTAEEARTSSRRNLVTRALGFDAAVAADEGTHPLAAGDTLLLCSDGVHGVVPEAELARACALPVEEAVAAIVDLANAHGGADNATAVVARVLGDRGERAAVTRPLPDGYLAAPPGAGAAALRRPRATAGRAAGGGRRFPILALLVACVIAAALLALVWSGALRVYL